MRQILIDAFLDYKNNYLTVKKYGEDNGLSYEEASAFINVCRTVYYAEHPEK